MEGVSDVGSALGAEIKLQPKAGAREVPGGFWWRFLASFIDNCIVGVINLPVSIPIGIVQQGLLRDGVATQMGPYVMTILAQYVFHFVTVFFFYGWFYKNKGATPGKLVCGLRVINAETGANISYWRTFGRESIGKLISAILLTIGFLMAAWTRDKTALHDLMFSTRVVRRVER